MRPQRQLIDHCPEERRYGDCQRTCVAAILDMDAADVPHFCGPPLHPKGHEDWWEARQNEWLAQFGLATFTVAYDGSASMDDVLDWTSRQSPTVPMILCGRGGKGVNHVVVILNGEIVCDPSGSGIVGPTLENTWEVQTLAAWNTRAALEAAGVAELRERISGLNEQLLEAVTSAHKWMEAHDKLKAGKPYDYPSPADVPELREENERRREALQEIAGLNGEINPSDYDHDDACYLNTQFCYALDIARAALTNQGKAQG